MYSILKRNRVIHLVRRIDMEFLNSLMKSRWKEKGLWISEFSVPVEPESILYNDYIKQRDHGYEDPTCDQPLVVRHQSFIHQPFSNQYPNSITL